MVYPLTYRRPSHVTASSRDSLNGDEKQRSIHESIQSGNSALSHGIPAALSFDRIIEGGTCPVGPDILKLLELLIDHFDSLSPCENS